MVAQPEKSSNPWYKESWAWFLLIPLIASVILSSIMVTTAFKYGDDVITDDYYKKGRLINQSLEQVEHAYEMGVTARIAFDFLTGEVNIVMTKDSGDELPSVLYLYLDHPVDENLDQVLEMKEFAPFNYRADLDRPLKNRWYLRLLPTNIPLALVDPEDLKAQENEAFERWRLNGEVNFAFQTDVKLIGQAPELK
ncbi:FixH family protein [Sessilibacter sp. MAH4]